MNIWHVKESDNSTMPAKYGLMLDLDLNTNILCKIVCLID